MILNVGIVGARARNTPEDKQLIKEVLERRLQKGDKIHLVSGGCPKGADRFAEELSEELRLGITIHYPDKSKLPEDSKRYDYALICYERNTLIARDSDILIALPGKSGGTWDTIRKTEALGKPVIIL